jgi:hypothetical protein
MSAYDSKRGAIIRYLSISLLALGFSDLSYAGCREIIELNCERSQLFEKLNIDEAFIGENGIPRRLAGNMDGFVGLNTNARFANFVITNAEVFGLTGTETWQVNRTSNIENLNLQSHRFNQFINDIPVIGGSIIVISDENIGTVREIYGTIEKDPGGLRTAPKLTAIDAEIACLAKRTQPAAVMPDSIKTIRPTYLAYDLEADSPSYGLVWRLRVRFLVEPGLRESLACYVNAISGVTSAFDMSRHALN